MKDRKLQELADKLQKARETVEFKYDMGGGAGLALAERQLQQAEDEYYAYRKELLEKNVAASCRDELIASRVAHNVMAWWGQRMVMDRGFYIPKNVNPEQIDNQGTDLDIRYWEEDGKHYGIAFAGKANKPLWYNRFTSRSSFDSKAKETIEGRQKRIEFMKKRMDDRRQFQHTLKVGDILYSSWGYDQTNVDWYQVTAIGDKSVKIREIAGRIESSHSGGTDYVVPVPNKFVGPDALKRVGQGNTIRLTSYSSAYPWDGKPKYQTALGWGH